MDASKIDFANYAWHQDETSTIFFENLAEVEELVKTQDTGSAVAKVQSLFNSWPIHDISSRLAPSELERIGSTCSPLRSAMTLSFAAVKYGRMSLTTTSCKEMRDGLKWCVTKMFRLLKNIEEMDEDSITPIRQNIMNFIAELSITTYEAIDLYVNPLSSTDIAASALQASYLAISCKLVKDWRNSLKYARRAVGLIERLDTGDDIYSETVVRIYDTAGVCERKTGDYRKGTEYLQKAEEFAKGMNDFVPNKVKKELMLYIKRNLYKT